MNPRRRWVWVGYFTGVGVLVLVLLGVSGQVLSLERREARARAETAQQESTRLALWQMDSWLAPVLAREARRPYFEYRPRLPVGRAYEHMWDPIDDQDPVVPSPLIGGVPEIDQAAGPGGERLIRLHLQIEPGGQVTSPQHPSDIEMVDLLEADPFIAMGTAERDRAGAILSVLRPMVQLESPLGSRRDRAADVGRLESVVPSSAMAPSASDAAFGEAGDVAGLLEDALYGSEVKEEDGLGEYGDRQRLLQLAQRNEAPEQYRYQNQLSTKSIELSEPAEERLAKAGLDSDQGLNLKGDAESEIASEIGQVELAYTNKDRASGEGASRSKLNEGAVADLAATEPEQRDAGEDFEYAADDGLRVPADQEKKQERNDDEGDDEEKTEVRISVGPLEPTWLSSKAGQPELLYLRRVQIGDEVFQQGVWLDWPVLSRALLESGEGLPELARLIPVSLSTRPDTAHQLATVPAVLRWPAASDPALGMTPARWSLLLTWLAVIISVGAIGVVLRAAMSLSDRRVRFVGAVTHELRTPLTTFRLYSQMLADGMVTEESSKREYLQTLKEESARLAGIVENVLAYARLNRTGRDQSRARTEVITPEALLVRLRPGLSRRAEQSGMDLIVSNEAGEAGSRELLVDPQSVEQILTNLVDNACKYAAPAAEEETGSEIGPDAETRIHLDLRVVGETLEILVADYGPGIDPADRAKVFGEFQRGRAGQRADRSGLGLGLALSRGLAIESGGELRLIRRRGHGAEFLLTLPMRPEAGASG